MAEDLFAELYFRNYDRLLSRGYSEERADLTAMAQTSLMQGTERLVRCEQGLPEDMDIREGLLAAVFTGRRTSSSTWSSGSGNDEDSVLSHDSVLLPEWEKFAGALTSATAHDRGYIRLFLSNVQLDRVVSDMLLQSFKSAPLRTLELANNGLGSHGIEFVVGALKRSPSIEALSVASNHVESELDAYGLISAANDHPTLCALNLGRCRIGQNNAVISAIVPSLYHMTEINLAGNCIGSHGAILISACLGRNPRLKVLDLDQNLLDDGDAKILAESLKTNTNLRWLSLCKNCITQAGIKALAQAVHSRSGLNDLYVSNHTCLICVAEDGDHFLSRANGYGDPALNRKLKILNAITCFNLRYTDVRSLDDAPTKIMPRVLAFIQDGRILSPAGRLGALFLSLREWNMRLFGAS